MDKIGASGWPHWARPLPGHAQKPKFLSQVKYYTESLFSMWVIFLLFFHVLLICKSPGQDRASLHTCNYYRVQCRRAHSELDNVNSKNIKELPNSSPNFNGKSCSDHTSTFPQTIQLCLPLLSPSYFNFPCQRFAFTFRSLAVPDSFYLNFILRAVNHYLF